MIHGQKTELYIIRLLQQLIIKKKIFDLVLRHFMTFR